MSDRNSEFSASSSRRLPNPPNQRRSASALEQSEWDEETSQRIRYPILTKLFDWKVSPNNKTRDARCKGCLEIILHAKVDRVITHSTKCCESDPNLVASLKAQLQNYRDTHELKRTASGRNKSETEKFFRDLDDALLEFVATASLPISIIENASFKHLIKILEPAYKVPTRRRFSSKLLPEKAANCKKIGFSQLKKCSNYTLTIEFDGWVSSAGASLLAFTATTKEGYSTLIDLVDVSAVRKDACALADRAAIAIEKSGIPLNRINAVITDEASNCKKARELIVSSLSTHVLEYRCLAHVGNLIIGLMSKCPSTFTTLKTLMASVREIRGNKILIAALREARARIPTNPSPTRWYTTSGSIDSLLAIYPDLEILARRPEFHGEKWTNLIKDTSFWSNLRGLRKYYDQLSAFIGYSERSDSKLSIAIRQLLEYGKFLFRLPEETQFKHAAIMAYVTHFCRLNLDLMLAVYFMDPNQKCTYLTPRAMKKAKVQVTATFIEIGNDTQIGPSVLKEISMYLDLSRIVEPIEDHYEWWESARLPLLKTIGMRFASLHASSANTERIFSALNQIVSPDRNRLNIETIHNLIAIKIFYRSESKRPHSTQTSSQQLASQLRDELQTGEEVEVCPHEACLLDERIQNECHQVESDESVDVYNTIEYLDFKSLIDFSLRPLDSLGEPRNEQGPHTRQTSAREEAAKIVSAFDDDL